MRRQMREIAPLAAVVSGFVLWSVAFLAVYGAQATGCGLGWDETALVGPLTLQRAVLLALFAIVMGGHAVLVRQLKAAAPGGDGEDAGTVDFMHTAARRLALLSAAASIVCFGGVVWLSPC